MKLHLGCGHNYLDGWVNVDGPREDLCYSDLKADIYTNIEKLEYPEDSVDEILMKAVFEHFPRHVAIIQLRKFYKWLKPDGKITILVPDFWGTVKMLKRSKSPQERQFWYRHLFGPQDTIKYGTHYDAFDVEKLEWMFSVVGFNKFDHEIIKRWPYIKFTGTKGKETMSDCEIEKSILYYMACCEAYEEKGVAFNSWMNQMEIQADKPAPPQFCTQKMYRKSNLVASVLAKLREMIK